MRSHGPVSLLVMATAGFGAIPSALGQSLYQQETFLHPPPPGGNHGFSLDIDGDWAVIGAPSPVADPYVTLFKYDPVAKTWNEHTVLHGIPYEAFGYSAALDGNTLVVGATDHSGDGALFVYHYNGVTWQPTVHTLNDPTPHGGQDKFGFSCDVQGNIVVGGDPTDDTPGGTAAGSVHVFDISQPAGSEFKQTLTGPPFLDSKNLGYSVAIDGEWIIAGASCQISNPLLSGYVQPYLHNATTGLWDSHPPLTDPNSFPANGYGFDVDVEGSTLVVACPFGDPSIQGGPQLTDAGIVYEYTSLPTGTSWSYTGSITADALSGYRPRMLDKFGWALSLDADVLVVSALGSTWYSPGSGLVLALARSGSTWVGSECIPSAPFDPPNGGGIGFGWNVAVDQGVVVASEISRPSVPGAGDQMGGAYVFRPVTWADYCFGDGAAVHAGPDCPCTTGGTPNNSVPRLHQGCDNSTALGGRLTVIGGTSILADDQVVHAFNLPINVTTLVFVGTQPVNLGLGAPLGDGLRCVGGPLRRLGAQAANQHGEANWGPNLAVQAGWVPGTTTYMQTFYRNSVGSPCGGGTLGFNETNAVRNTIVP